MRFFAELENVILIEEWDKNDEINVNQSNWRSDYAIYLDKSLRRFLLENDCGGERSFKPTFEGSFHSIIQIGPTRFNLLGQKNW